MAAGGRRPYILGNSKMNLTVARALAYLESFLPQYRPADDREVGLAIPFTALASVGARLRGHDIRLAAQDLFWEDEGSYTGEISAPMIREMGATDVILGHSERRAHLGEDDAMVNRKVRAALRGGLRPVICVGETGETRRAGGAVPWVRNQVIRALEGVAPASAVDVVVAYEPIWAIGTGKAATPADASEMHAVIRGEVERLLGAAGAAVRILYGGSVTPDNIDSLMASSGVDGVLVGGASLKPGEFLRIARFLPPHP